MAGHILGIRFRFRPSQVECMDDERYFAGCALQALIALNHGDSPEKIAKQAVAYAIAMKQELDARRGGSPSPFGGSPSPAPRSAVSEEPNPFAKPALKPTEPKKLTETEMAKDALLEEYRKNNPRR